MTALIIIGVLLLIVIVILFLPVSFFFKYDDDFFMKVKIAGIRVYDLAPDKDLDKSSAVDTESDAKAEKQEKNFFEKLKDKHGFTGAVKETFKFVSELLQEIDKHLRHIGFRRFILDITVATDNAAKTAIEYGVVCTAVYPVLTYLNSCAKVNVKSVNVRTDYDKTEPDFKVACVARVRIIFAFRVVKTIALEYHKFKSRNEL